MTRSLQNPSLLDPPRLSNAERARRVADGFPDQILIIVPQLILKEALRNRLFNALYPTDIGWFPKARDHYFERPQGCSQHVFLYCREGEGFFEITGRRRESLRQGEAVFLPKGLPHLYGATDHAPWSIHWVHFDGCEAPSYLSYLPPGTHKMHLSSEAAEELQQIFQKCYAAFQNGYSMPSLLHITHLLRLILSLVFFGGVHDVDEQSLPHPWKLNEIIQFMQENLREGLTLNDLARQVSFSRSQLSATFKAQTGFSPMDYYTHLRIQEACRLLDMTALSIKEISFMLGFENQYYFSRVFHKVMGLPPSAYRCIDRG